MIRAAVYEGTPGRLMIESFDRPHLRTGEILVRIRAATICGSDRHTVEGRRTVPVPTILGHEIIGEVVETAEPRTDCAVGDLITWAIVANCGHCLPCTDDLPQKCERSLKYGHEAIRDGTILTGGFAEFCVLAPGTTVVPIPAGLPIEVATPANCATATVMAAMDGVSSGQSVLIIGCGLLGLTACAVAAIRGASRVVAVDPDESRRNQALRFGATVARSPQEIDDDTSFFDVALEFSGVNAGFRSLWPRARLGGRIVLIGSVFPGAPVELPLEQIVRRCLTIRGVHNYAPRHLVEAVRFLSDHHTRFPFAELLSAWYPLDEIDTAFHAAADPRHLRVGIRP